MTRHELYCALLHQYRISRTMYNNSILERHIEELEAKADTEVCRAALDDSYANSEPVSCGDKMVCVQRIDFMTKEELLSMLYALKAPVKPDFSTLFARREDDIMLIDVIGNSMKPALYQNDIVVVRRGERIIDQGIHLVQFREGQVLKRIIPDNEGYLLTSDNTAFPPMYALPGQFKVLGVVIFIIKPTYAM